MPDFIQRNRTELAAKIVLDDFLVPDQFEHPFRRSAAVALADCHSDLAREDRASLYAAMDKHPQLGAMFAQSVIAKNLDPIKFPEVRKFVIDEIPNVKDSVKQADLLFELTKEKLTPQQASFVVKNVLDYFEKQVITLPEERRFSHGGDLDLRFFALQRTSEFHTAEDKHRLSQLARADDELAHCVHLLNGRAPAEGQQHAPASHTQDREDLHSDNDSDRENRAPDRHYDERSRGNGRTR